MSGRSFPEGARWRELRLLGLVFLAACPSRGSETDVRGIAAAIVSAADGGTLPSLPVRGGDHEHADLSIEVRALACDGACADVVAEIHGGHPPYHVEWEDGATAATRYVCLQKEDVKVTVADTPGFDSDIQSAVATLTRNSLECPVAEEPSADLKACARRQPISRNAAIGCKPLQRRPHCGEVTDDNGGVFALPFTLRPGDNSCLIAFGNTNGNSWSRDGELSLFIAGVQHLVIESDQHCGSSTEVLYGSALGNESLPGNSDPSHGRVLCLRDPRTEHNELMVYPGTGWGTLGDAQLLMCEQCPAAQ